MAPLERLLAFVLAAAMQTGLGACGSAAPPQDNTPPPAETQTDGSVQADDSRVTEGTETYRGFVLDNVLHSEQEGDIHYNVYIPESYDGSEPYALYFILPGYEGLYLSLIHI